MIEKMKSAKPYVEKLLTQFPRLRDDDFKLIANCWHKEIKNDPSIKTASDFLRVFSQGRLTHPETIRRTRAKIQEQTPELRGTNYNGRKIEGQQTKIEINNL